MWESFLNQAILLVIYNFFLFLAAWIKKPTFSVVNDELTRAPICVGSEDGLPIILEGSPPFVLFFMHNFTSSTQEPSQISEKKQVISLPVAINGQSDRFTGYFDLENLNAGVNTYHFLSIGDSNYDTPIRLENSISLRQSVDSTPIAEFMDKKDITFHCLSEKPRGVILPIKLTGHPPFHLILLFSNHEHKEVLSFFIDEQKLSSKNGSLIYEYEPDNILMIGSYSFEIMSVKDATSCTVDYQNNAAALDLQTSLSIHIVDQAKIISNNPQVLCVGDMLTYALQGTAPFTVGYSWKGIQMKEVVVTDPILTLYAAEPGVLSIDRVCNSMKCCADTMGAAIVEIMNLPSAIVDGGEDMVEDIREGEESMMVVEFKGTPPFSLSWSRSELDEDQQRDSFSVSNIEVFKYSISTQQSGIFTVTRISDKVCYF